ncbi:hypothetical protein, partial [Mycobacterium tuberculosis]
RPCDDAGRVGPLRRTAMGLGRVTMRGRVGPLRRTAMGLGGVTMRAGHGRVTTLMLCLFEPRPPCAAPD